jgi:phosphoribosylamine--glycine ligase
MKILVVGGGGREHAITWKLASDTCNPEIYCAPGNAGTAGIATNLDIGAEDLDSLLAWARENQPNLTIVGPEAPLCKGLVNMLSDLGLPAFGPMMDAAQLEGSKVFAKEIMDAAGVPTARSGSFSDVEDAIAYVKEVGAPVVVKADGLAAGKGVMMCSTEAEALAAINNVMLDRLFGGAGNQVLIEEMLVGEEASILALVDGESIVMLASSQDHKRAFDHDEGPNTGGMGAYSPAPVVTDELWPLIKEAVFDRTLAELRKRGIIYKGVLYAGVMVTQDGPKVLEFNCRFGDPETQAVLARLDSDLTPALMACVNGDLADELVAWKSEPSVCVVMASGGYPGSYEKGKAIDGLQDAGSMDNVVVFHAGTSTDGEDVVTSGGRVLGVTALGSNVEGAAAQAYAAVGKIQFEKAQYRKDIAARAIGRA